MPLLYDDNYGFYEDADDPETREFYNQVQKNSVWKKCSKCGKKVKLRKDYSICNSCAEKMERGWDF